MNRLTLKVKGVLFFIALAVFLFNGVSFSTTNNSIIHISHYEFGKIIVNEKVHTKDIAIWPDGNITPGPEDMHFLHTSDFDEFFNSGLKKLVIGTGDEGAMENDFSRKLEKHIKNKGIELIMMNTHDLVKFLNETKDRDFLTLVHLNC